MQNNEIEGYKHTLIASDGVRAVVVDDSEEHPFGDDVLPGDMVTSIPLYRQADSLLVAAKGLKRIIEEIDGAMNHGTWRDENGTRLKDTPEWVKFYNAIAGRSPAVAALEWKGIVPISESIVGTYSIHRIGGEWRVRLSVHPHLHETQIASGKSPDFETALIDAKAAAQRDYENRILSALVSHPPQSAPVDSQDRGNVINKASSDVLAERRRQIEAEGWSATHDDQYRQNELVRAAMCYLLGNPGSWPWAYDWWKPGDPRRNLIKAAALIIAEIERLDRSALSAPLTEKEKGNG
ncbi:hypothetical protein GGE68_001387 [Rhizobium leguminosarum]|uniref:hypothetical protein n=1 Tax=Rhizobium leguminosarum TaxID=384 RepID=UPI00161E17A4|nr:hypothetical protein [Rhizobium leguminosarum]MBB5663211.1 hypothetical protein [Rhizobium leguminosarum]